MLVFHYNYRAILKDPTLILSVLYCELQFLYLRQKLRYHHFTSRFLEYFKKRLMVVRLVRSEKNYPTETIFDIITRWYRLENYKIDVHSKLVEREFFLKIVELAKTLNIPQYEIRAYVEHKIKN